MYAIAMAYCGTADNGSIRKVSKGGLEGERSRLNWRGREREIEIKKEREGVCRFHC